MNTTKRSNLPATPFALLALGMRDDKSALIYSVRRMETPGSTHIEVKVPTPPLRVASRGGTQATRTVRIDAHGAAPFERLLVRELPPLQLRSDREALYSGLPDGPLLLTVVGPDGSSQYTTVAGDRIEVQ